MYDFNVKPGKVEAFTEAWRTLTQLIYTYEGSLGSRLHRGSEYHYIAYALWPDRDTWANSGSNLPESAEEVRKQLREACKEIKTLHEITVVDDLIQGSPSDPLK